MRSINIYFGLSLQAALIYQFITLKKLMFGNKAIKLIFLLFMVSTTNLVCVSINTYFNYFFFLQLAILFIYPLIL